ncbi:MAG: PAS domain S-box protein [Desulfobacteraceae bacterium]
MRFRSNEVKKDPPGRSPKLFPGNVFNSIKDGVSILDGNGIHIYVNPAFCQMTGYNESELLGSGPPYRYWPKENKIQIHSILTSDFNGCLDDIELVLKRKDGKRFPVIVNSSVLSNENSGATYYITTISFNHLAANIWDQKKAEEALKQSEHRYRSLVENSFFGLFIADIHSGKFLFLNKRLCDFFGYTVEEGLHLSVWDFINPEEHEVIRKILEKWPLDYENASTKSGIFTGVKKDGSIIRIEINATIITYDGELSVQGLVNDVTKEEYFDEKLRQVQKMEAIGTLAGGISHDFNNILGAIIGYSELANFQLKKNKPAEDSIDQILKAGYRARDLVSQILAFSRKSENELKPIYLKPLVKEVLKLIKASLPSTIEIKNSLKQETGVVMGDPTQIHQIMMNLCTNSAHAMGEEGGILEVSLYDVSFEENVTVSHPEMAPGEYIVLSVRDTGHGMAPEVRERIFEPYFTTKDKGVGTGMGLAVVHGIVKSYGGTINVDSEPGVGTTFRIYLPEVKIGRASDMVAAEKRIPRGNEKILFVDDEVALARLGKKLLENLGYRVSIMTDSPEAFKLFYSDPKKFDLVITDMTMPGLTGTNLMKKIRDVRPDTPIILCTGYSEIINEEKALNMGINAFIMKPLVIQELAVKVREVLGP